MVFRIAEAFIETQPADTTDGGFRNPKPPPDGSAPLIPLSVALRELSVPLRGCSPPSVGACENTRLTEETQFFAKNLTHSFRKADRNVHPPVSWSSGQLRPPQPAPAERKAPHQKKREPRPTAQPGHLGRGVGARGACRARLQRNCTPTFRYATGKSEISRTMKPSPAAIPPRPHHATSEIPEPRGSPSASSAPASGSGTS